MSNFGQGFQNGFDPSLLYNMGGAGGVGNVSNVGNNMGNVGGMNLGDQQKVGQNQPFNLGNLGGMGAGGLGGGNMGGGGNAGNSSLPPGWLNQFASLQSQASQQLNPNAQGGAGQGLNTQNLGMLNSSDGQQRQMEILRSMQATRLTNNGIPNASPQQNQQANSNFLAQQLFAQRQQQASAAAGQQQNPVAGQQQRPQLGGQQPNLQNKDLSNMGPMISQYTNMLAKNNQVTPEMQAAMQRL
jgi:hypothetical protein